MWPFKRKRNPGPINEDWAYGDLAQTLEGGNWDGDGVGPDTGDVCKVLEVRIGRDRNKQDDWFLVLGGYPGAFAARHFRKVPPLNSACDAEFAVRIKRLKPARVKA